MDADAVQPVERSDVATVKSAVRVLDLLETLTLSRTEVGASDLARRLSIPKSSTHMLLATLEDRGYVVSDAARRFRLHPALMSPMPSWVGGARGALLRAARPVLRQLVEETGESAFLAVSRDSYSFEYVDKALSPHEVRCDADLGGLRPLHSTSLGLVILAFQAVGLSERYLGQGQLARLTPHTLTDPATLRRELDLIRKRGYAITRDTNSIGASGLAVPVLLGGGGVAALNVTAPSTRFEAMADRAVDLLREQAAVLTRDLGGAPPESRGSPADDPPRPTRNRKP